MRERRIQQNASRDPVVITGFGVMSIEGFGPDALMPLIRNSDNLPVSRIKTPRSIELEEPFVKQRLGKKGLRLLDQPTLLALLTAQAALADSAIDLDTVNTNRIAVSVGTAMGSADSRYDFYHAALAEGIAAANPAKFPFTIANAVASQIALRFQLKGINSSISAGCASSLAALAWAATQLYSGRVDAVLLTAAEALSGSLVTRLQHIPGIASASLADGAVSLILEKQSTALSRGQKNYAQLSEYFCGTYSKMQPFSARDYLAQFNADSAPVYSNGYFYKLLKYGVDSSENVTVMDTTSIAGDTLSASGLMQIIYAFIDSKTEHRKGSTNREHVGEKTPATCHVVCSCPSGYVGHASLVINHSSRLRNEF